MTSQAASPAGTFESTKQIAVNGVSISRNENVEEIYARLGNEDLSEWAKYSKEPDFIEKCGFYPMMTKIVANRYSNAALYYEMLLKTRRLIRGAVGNATEETKAHYEYMLYKIDKMLKDK